ncbi:MAG: polyhydroxyalkanoic acid system family protein [Bdellovibrionaceae bacterium]|nr:polyhydroxyalkanoic acid system family protein [Pseudobdellovibrionaceae bacterium]
MPKITVNHDSTTAPSEAFEKIKNFFETDQDIRKLASDMKVTFTDSAMTGKATASQFSADFSVKPEGAGSKVSVLVDLPFILTPFKGKVQETLEKKLKKYLA